MALAKAPSEHDLHSLLTRTALFAYAGMAEPPAADESLLPVAVVGAGRVGTALAQRLHGAGYEIAAVISRSIGSARRLAEATKASVASDALGDLPNSARLVFLTVSDAQVRSVAEALAEHTAMPWSGRLALHTSGALPASALAPLAEAGARTLSFHPLQTFAPDTPPEAFADIFVSLEGTPDAVAAGRPLVESLGARSLVLTAQAKTRYHLAASMASNFLVTLVGMAEEVLGDALDEGSLDSPRPPASESPADADSRSFGNRNATRVLLPLLEGTLRNLHRTSPAAALTGSIARGDVETVTAHIEALRAHHPGFLPAYTVLATETVRLAARADALPSSTIDHLLRLLSESLDAFANVPLPLTLPAERQKN